MIFRILGPFGLAILFFLSSADFRQMVLDGMNAVVSYLQNYSPFSYIGLGLIAAFFFLFSLKPKAHESSIL